MSASVRVQRFEKEIGQVAARFLIGNTRPFLRNLVTVQRVEVPPDLKSAKILCSFYGADDAVPADLETLKSFSAELQREIGRSLKTKHTPRVTFVRDRGLEHLFFVDERLKEIRSGSRDA
jgi:ribosome-binding factor A